MEQPDEANPWKVLHEETGYECRYFSIRHDRVTLSDGETVHNAFPDRDFEP